MSEFYSPERMRAADSHTSERIAAPIRLVESMAGEMSAGAYLTLITMLRDTLDPKEHQ